MEEVKISLETLVSENHILRAIIDKAINFSFPTSRSLSGIQKRPARLSKLFLLKKLNQSCCKRPTKMPTSMPSRLANRVKVSAVKTPS